MTQELPRYAGPGDIRPAVHDGLAVASLVLGLLWLFGIGSALAVIFGHLSDGAARREQRSRSALAVSGLVLGYFGAGVTLLFVLGAYWH